MLLLRVTKKMMKKIALTARNATPVGSHHVSVKGIEEISTSQYLIDEFPPVQDISLGFIGGKCKPA